MHLIHEISASGICEALTRSVLGESILLPAATRLPHNSPVLSSPSSVATSSFRAAQMMYGQNRYKSTSFSSSGAAKINFRGRGGEIRRAICRPRASAAPEAASVAAAQSPQTNTSSSEPLLLRAARGEHVERPPVWLMRQAGRYMAEFREYSTKVPFRVRSETPDIAFELSLQPYRAFQTDGVIMFSDILTPLPAIGVDFDIVRGMGPAIQDPVRTDEAAKRIAAAEFKPEQSLPFVAELLERLKDELAEEPTTLLGFVGAPFTLAAYTIEGRGSKVLAETKQMMLGGGPDRTRTFETILNTFADLVGKYSVFQIDHGAQIIQFFDSWAHHLSPNQYKRYALPAALRAIRYVKQQRPAVPIVFFANGCGGKLEDISAALSGYIDVLQLDWSVSMAAARQILGPDMVLQGNVDPSILLAGDEDSIRASVRECVREAGPSKHILNIGHGVIKETPEKSVAIFCDEARMLYY